MGFASEVADHVYFTDGGMIVESGTPTDIFKAAQNDRTRAFLSQVL
jgi:polar amino acid transport system ATP-binding protein